MPTNPQTAVRRYSSGKFEYIVIAVICVLLAIAFLYIMFKIIGHSEEHVEKVRKTKVNVVNSLAWRPDKSFGIKRIQADLASDPNRLEAEYKDMRLSEAAIKLISEMSRLERLDLRRSIVRDQWLVHLRNLPLASLSLYGTPITDKAIPTILEFPKLSQLNIGDTDVSDKGLKLLSTSKQLRILRLKKARGLTTSGLRHISHLKRLRGLDLSDSLDNVEVLYELVKLKRLYSLRLENVDLEPADLRALARLKKLGILTLRSTGLNDRCLAELARIKTLTTLNISRNGFSDKGLIDLERLSNLRLLIMNECPNVSSKGLAKLKQSLPGCQVRHSRQAGLIKKLERPDIKQEMQMLESGTSIYLKDRESRQLK